MDARSAPSRLRSSSTCQSIGARSTKAATMAAAGWEGWSGPPQLRREAGECAAERHACGIGRPSDHAAELCVTVVELHVSDDQFLIAAAELRECSAIPAFSLCTHRQFEW